MATPQMVNFTDPYATEQAQIERNRRLAQALQQQASQDLPTGNMAGGYFVATNPLQYLAQAVKGYGAQRGMQQADDAQKSLQERATTARTGEMSALVKALQGTPDRSAALDPQEIEQSADQGTPLMTTVPGRPGDPNAAAALALGSQFGDIRSMAPGLMNLAETRANRVEDRTFRTEQADAAKQARMAELQMRLQDSRLAAQDRANLQRELAQMQIEARRDMAAMTAANRLPAQVQTIQTDAGIFRINPDGTTAPLVTPDGRPLNPKPTGKGSKSDVDVTMDVYTQASSGLISALDASTTGPIAGRIPAVTTDQQTAEGGVAAMAPVLKSIFRVAGEGAFTDKDQELLMQMVPTRKDSKEARQQKISNIDNIVSAKLGVPPPKRDWDAAAKPMSSGRRATDGDVPPPGAVREKK